MVAVILITTQSISHEGVAAVAVAVATVMAVSEPNTHTHTHNGTHLAIIGDEVKLVRWGC